MVKIISGKKMKNKTIQLIMFFLVLWIGAAVVLAALIETFRWYPIQNNITQDGTQYSDSLTATKKDTAAYYYFARIDPGYGVRGMLFSVMSMKIVMPIEYRANDTAGTPANLRWWIDGRDTTRSVTTGWQRLCDTQRVSTTLDTVYKVDSLQGYIKLDSIKYLPALIRLGIRSDSINCAPKVRITNGCYFDGIYKSLY